MEYGWKEKISFLFKVYQGKDVSLQKIMEKKFKYYTKIAKLILNSIKLIFIKNKIFIYFNKK